MVRGPCAVCGAEEAPFKCDRCFGVRYCGPECFESDTCLKKVAYHRSTAALCEAPRDVEALAAKSSLVAGLEAGVARLTTAAELPSTVLRSPAVLLHILHFVRNGADFLRCELVCVAWRGVVGEDALWEPRPIGYGDGVVLPKLFQGVPTRFVGRRGCLKLPAIWAIRHVQRTTEGAFESVVGPVNMRRFVDSIYVRCCKDGDPRPRFTDGAVAAICDVVEQWLGGIMEGSLRCMMYRSHTGKGDDDLSTFVLPETGGTLGLRDFFFQLHGHAFAPGRTSAAFVLISIENWLAGVVPFSNEFESTVKKPCARAEYLHQEMYRKALLRELVNDSNSGFTRIVRRIARRASVIRITGAAMESASCYCVGAIGALLKVIYLLHPDFSHSELPPSDVDYYSSVDETSDDENPVPYELPQYATWVQPEVHYPSKSGAPFTVTSATVAYAAESLGIVDRYYPARPDDGDSDGSSDEDTDGSSGSMRD